MGAFAWWVFPNSADSEPFTSVEVDAQVSRVDGGVLVERTITPREAWRSTELRIQLEVPSYQPVDGTPLEKSGPLVSGPPTRVTQVTAHGVPVEADSSQPDLSRAVRVTGTEPLRLSYIVPRANGRLAAVVVGSGVEHVTWSSIRVAFPTDARCGVLSLSGTLTKARQERPTPCGSSPQALYRTIGSHNTTSSVDKAWITFG